MTERQTLHTFLFADLSSFTALTEAHGDEEAADIAADFYESVRATVSKYDAAAIKEIGDAVMIRCNDAAQAVALGIDLVGEIGTRHGFPSVRVGMHTGPAVEREGDWFGATVNIAARVADLAGGGEVLLTDATRRAGSGIDGIELRKRGEHELKNVSESLMLYSALPAGERSGTELLVDPVCGMTIQPGHEAGRLVHADVEYRFCSLECARSFAADPQRFHTA